MKKLKTLIFTNLAIFSYPLFSFAQLMNPLGSDSIPNIVSTVMYFIVRVGAVVAVVAFIYVGFVFVRAQGKPEEIKKAKDMFFWTVIGVAILLGAQLLSQLVVGTIKSLGR